MEHRLIDVVFAAFIVGVAGALAVAAVQRRLENLARRPRGPLKIMAMSTALVGCAILLVAGHVYDLPIPIPIPHPMPPTQETWGSLPQAVVLSIIIVATAGGWWPWPRVEPDPTSPPEILNRAFAMTLFGGNLILFTARHPVITAGDPGPPTLMGLIMVCTGALMITFCVNKRPAPFPMITFCVNKQPAPSPTNMLRWARVLGLAIAWAGSVLLGVF